MVLDSIACNNVSFSENHAFYCFLVHEESLTIDMQSFPYWSNAKQLGPRHLLLPHWKLLLTMFPSLYHHEIFRSYYTPAQRSWRGGVLDSNIEFAISQEPTYLLNDRLQMWSFILVLANDIDLEISRSDIWLPISLGKMVHLSENEKGTCWLKARPKGDHPLWPWLWPWPWISGSNIQFAISQEKNCLIATKRNRYINIGQYT